MYLIYQADAINAANDAADDWDGGPNKGREEMIRNGISAIPLIPAVPLEPLAEWLAGYAEPPLDALTICDNPFEAWKMTLTKWMEEQDADRE